MAYNITRNDNDIAHGIKEYCCDTPEDINVLPTSAEMGSLAVVISTGDVYILNSEEQWIKL